MWVVNQVQLCAKPRKTLCKAIIMGLLGLAPLPESPFLLGSLCDPPWPCRDPHLLSIWRTHPTPQELVPPSLSFREQLP